MFTACHPNRPQPSQSVQKSSSSPQRTPQLNCATQRDSETQKVPAHAHVRSLWAQSEWRCTYTYRVVQQDCSQKRNWHPLLCLRVRLFHAKVYLLSQKLGLQVEGRGALKLNNPLPRGQDQEPGEDVGRVAVGKHFTLLPRICFLSRPPPPSTLHRS